MSKIKPRGNSWDTGLFVHSEVDENDLDVYEFRVYAHLCRRANDELRVWAGQQKIADVCRISRKKVNEALRALEEKGWIRQEHQFREDGSQTTNNIVILGPPRVTHSYTPLPSEDPPTPVTVGDTPCNSQLHPLSPTVTAEVDPLEGDPREVTSSATVVAGPGSEAGSSQGKGVPAAMALAMQARAKRRALPIRAEVPAQAPTPEPAAPPPPPAEAKASKKAKAEPDKPKHAKETRDAMFDAVGPHVAGGTDNKAIQLARTQIGKVATLLLDAGLTAQDAADFAAFMQKECFAERQRSIKYGSWEKWLPDFIAHRSGSGHQPGSWTDSLGDEYEGL